VKLAVVVQRYGQTISGGAELHSRYVAEHLARHAEVDVLTTYASDYVTWRNEPLPEREAINGIPVRRFRVDHERDLFAFSRHSEKVFEHQHSLADELRWLDAEGPTSTALVNHVAEHAASYDFCLFFSYRYYQAYHGARAAAGRAVLVPTAERDPAIGLSLFQSLFRGVRALMYNSPEEQAMIQAVSGNQHVPSVVVGVGSEVPQNPEPARFRQKYAIHERFAIYVGRIDENKGCKELFAFFEGYLHDVHGTLSLVLVGQSLLPIPEHPRIRHLGFLDDADKFDAMAAAEMLIVPSYFESLSMVTLEAFGLGRPVVANGQCDVLKGQCLRSNAGLCYDNYPEFLATVRALEESRRFGTALGTNGRRFFRDNYEWGVIEHKYLDVLERLQKAPAVSTMEPLPPWLERRRRSLPPARAVVARLPKGAALGRAPADAPRTATAASGTAS
jgi:glycosyltransferase involved in cell wall biosynthesis